MKKTVLVDLSALVTLYHGLGQVALSYGKYFKENYRKESSDYELTLLVPKKLFGTFGNEVKYIDSSNWLRKHCKYLFPKYDVWHSIHQLSRFKPAYKETKYILTVHDLNYLYELTGKDKQTKQRRIQRKINRAQEIVCISEFAKSEIQNNLQLNGKECKVIYNQVPAFDNYNAQKPNTEIASPFFFTIGSIQMKKNFHVLLDMMKLMPEKQLYIAGLVPMENTEYFDKINQRIKLENINNVTFLGGISDGEKTWMYQHCEAFVFPSLFEGFGLPIIEAMQFGKPVFSSQETSLLEIGNKFAFFWTDFNPENMKSLIVDNLDKFYRNKMFIKEEVEYANSFSTNKHFEEYEKLYNSLLQ